MKTTLLTIGAWKEPAMRELFYDYANRCQPRLNLVELPQPKAATGLKEKEAALFLKHWPKQGTVIICDERGKSLTSRQLATYISQSMDKNGPDVTFIIGGADGLHDSIVQKADLKLGLGALTWPHLLVRVLLAEQIYRSQMILVGHPYHRD